MSVFSGSMQMGRILSEARMSDMCTIGVYGQTGNIDETTGLYSYDFDPLHYIGKCEVFFPVVKRPDEVFQQEQDLVKQSIDLKLPMVGSELVTVGDIVRIDSSATDTALAGMQFRIVSIYAKTYSTKRRFLVEKVT